MRWFGTTVNSTSFTCNFPLNAMPDQTVSSLACNEAALLCKSFLSSPFSNFKCALKEGVHQIHLDLVIHACYMVLSIQVLLAHTHTCTYRYTHIKTLQSILVLIDLALKCAEQVQDNVSSVNISNKNQTINGSFKVI